MTSDETYAHVAPLPLTIERCELRPIVRDTTSGFTKISIVVRLSGGGHVGEGEDITWDQIDQIELLRAGGDLSWLHGTRTFDELSRLLALANLFPVSPIRQSAQFYRRWAFESAALDLALRQNGVSLQDAVGHRAQPVNFVASIRVGDPPDLSILRTLLDENPQLRFKLDPTASWDEALVAELVATGAVDTVDLKGLYKGSVVDNPADPALYRLVAEGFPDAWIEDPAITDETWPALEPHQDRITWDGNIHSVEDIISLPFPPHMVNVKPSRLGGLRPLFKAYEYCEDRGITMYGGGQFELGVGRGQIQYLAAIFHPDGPNDVAPGGYNDVEPPAGLPTSPLPVAASATGFRWG